VKRTSPSSTGCRAVPQRFWAPATARPRRRASLVDLRKHEDYAGRTEIDIDASDLLELGKGRDAGGSIRSDFVDAVDANGPQRVSLCCQTEECRGRKGLIVPGPGIVLQPSGRVFLEIEPSHPGFITGLA
jgi:hypothetical protein